MVIQKKEELRKLKQEAAHQKNEDFLDINRQKQAAVSAKHQDLMKKLEQRKDEIRREMAERRALKEEWKHKTFQNLKRIEWEKEQAWEDKVENERLKDIRLRNEKQKAKMEQ